MATASGGTTAAVVFSHTVEGLLARVFVRRGWLEQALPQLRALGIDPARPTDVRVPVWRDLLRLAASLVAPGRPEDEAMRAVGREMALGFQATLVGKMMFTVFRLRGLDGAIQTAVNNYRNADNATQVVPCRVDDRAWDLRFHVDDGIPFPTYTQGLLTEMGRMLGHEKTLQVTYEVLSPVEVVYRIRW